MRSIDNIYNIISSKELSESVKSGILQNIMSYVDFQELTEGLNEDYRDKALTSSFRTLIESDMSESTIVSIGEELMDTFSLEDISHSLDIIKCELVLEAFAIENNYLNEKNYIGYQIPFESTDKNNKKGNISPEKSGTSSEGSATNRDNPPTKLELLQNKIRDKYKEAKNDPKEVLRNIASDRIKGIKAKSQENQINLANLTKDIQNKEQAWKKADNELKDLKNKYNSLSSPNEKSTLLPLIDASREKANKLEKEYQDFKAEQQKNIDRYEAIATSLKNRQAKEQSIIDYNTDDNSLSGKIKNAIKLINDPKGTVKTLTDNERRTNKTFDALAHVLRYKTPESNKDSKGNTDSKKVAEIIRNNKKNTETKTEPNNNEQSTETKIEPNENPKKAAETINNNRQAETTGKHESDEDKVYKALKNLQNTFKDVEKNGYGEESSKNKTYFVNSKKANEEIDKLELTDEQKNSLKALIGDNLKGFTSKSEDELKNLLKNNQSNKEKNFKVEDSKVENKTKNIEATPEDREKHLFMLLNNVKAEMGKEKGRRIPFETANNLFDTIYKDLSDKDSNFSVTPEEKEYFKKKFVNKDGLISFEDLNIEGLQNTVKDYLKTKNTEKKEEVKETPVKNTENKEEVKETPVKNTEKKEEVKNTPTLNTTKNNLEEIKKQDNPDQGDKIYNSLLKVLIQDGDNNAIKSALGGRADYSLYPESIKKVRDQIKDMKEKDPNVSFEEGNENWDKLMTLFKDSIGANKDGVEKGGKKQSTSPKQTISEQPAPKSNFVKNTLKAMQGQNSKEYLEANKDSLANELPRNLKDLRDKLTSKEDKKTVDDIIKQSLGRRLRGGLDKETLDTFKDDFELLNQGTLDANGRYQFNQETIDKWNDIKPDTDEKQNAEDNKAIMKASKTPAEKTPAEKTPAEEEQKTSTENKEEKEEDATPNEETSSKEEKINQLSDVEKADLNNWQTKFNEGKNLSASQKSKLRKLAKTNEEAKNLLDKFEERKNNSKEKDVSPTQLSLLTGDLGNE